MVVNPNPRWSHTAARSAALVTCCAVFAVLGLGAASAWVVERLEASADHAVASHQAQADAQLLAERLKTLQDLSLLQARTLAAAAGAGVATACPQLAQSLIDAFAFVQGAGLIGPDGRPGPCFAGRRPGRAINRGSASVTAGAWRWYAHGESGSLSTVDLEGAGAGKAVLLVVSPEYLQPARPPAGSALAALTVTWGSEAAAQASPPGLVVQHIALRSGLAGELRATLAPRPLRTPLLIAVASCLLAAAVGALSWALLRRRFVRPAAELHRLALAPLADHAVDRPMPAAQAAVFGPCFEALVDLRARWRELERQHEDLEHCMGNQRIELQVLQREARIGFWETDLRSGHIRWSPQTYVIFGLAQDEDIDLQKLRAVMPPGEAERFAPKQSAAAQGVEALDFVHRIVRPDGSERVVRERGSLDFDESGTPAFLRGTVMDVTDAHVAESELDLLRQVVMRGSDAMALCGGLPGDPAGRIMICNQGFEALFEADRAAPGPAWSRLWERPGHHLADARDAVSEAIASGRPAQRVLRWGGEDGGSRELELRIVPLQPAAWMDRQPRWALVVQDVTAQRRTEQALVESERRFRELFDQHPLPMWTYDPQTLRFVDVNQKAIAAYGYTAEQFRAMSLLDIRPAQDSDRLVEAVHSSRAGADTARLWRHRRADGRELIVEAYGASLRSGGQSLRVVCPVDRSAEVDATLRLKTLNASLDLEIARRSTALASSERLYRTLAELSPQIIWQAAPDGRVTYLNPSWLALVGGAMDDWLGVGWMTALVPEDRERVELAFLEALKSRSPMRVQRRVLDRQGQVRHLLGSASPVLDEQGDVEAWIGVDADVTELMRQREQLDTLNDELEAFVYSVSHDLRAPVDAVRGFAQGIAQGKLGHVDGVAGKYLERIADNARRMDTLIQELLKLSQIGRRPLDVERVDLQPLAAALAAELDERHAARAIDWQLQLDAVVEADRELLRVALDNLLGNAVKFTASRPRAQISVSARMHAGEVAIVVQDNGVGFPAAYAHKLFRPFQRLHSRQAFPGLGVGLATVERVAKRHGGRISGHSAEGSGATFTLVLPLRAVELGQAEAAQKDPA